MIFGCIGWFLSQKPIKVAVPMYRDCAVDMADVEIMANGSSHIPISDLRFFSAEVFRYLLKTTGVLVCNQNLIILIFLKEDDYV